MRRRKPRGQIKTTCSKCSNIIEANRLGKSRYCRLCGNAAMRLRRKKHSELSESDRKKANARSYVNVYIRRGNIVKEPCIICGLKGEMHHEDYNKPLLIRWLCKEHHIKLHNDKDFESYIHSLPTAQVLFKRKVKNNYAIRSDQ